MINLTNVALTAAIDPEAGGRLTSFTVDGFETLADDARREPDFYRGSFPLAPWCGQWPGRGMHGLVHSTGWAVEQVTDTTARLTAAVATPEGSGTAELCYELGDHHLVQRLSLTADAGPWPVALGLHPWFRAGATYTVEPVARWELEGDWPRRRTEDLGARPWDDIFELARDPVVAWSGGPTLRLSSDAPVWVVYERQEHGFCIEPWTDTDGPAEARTAGPLGRGDVASVELRIGVER